MRFIFRSSSPSSLPSPDCIPNFLSSVSNRLASSIQSIRSCVSSSASQSSSFVYFFFFFVLFFSKFLIEACFDLIPTLAVCTRSPDYRSGLCLKFRLCRLIAGSGLTVPSAPAAASGERPERTRAQLLPGNDAISLAKQICTRPLFHRL